MSTQSKLTAQTLVPVGAVLAIAITVIGYVRSFDDSQFKNQLEVVKLKADVSALEGRVALAEGRLEKADGRWVEIREDLAAIKNRLGIVESKAPK